MLIKSLKIKNFRGVHGEKNFVFEGSPFVLLYAPNGIGKTTMIDAIEWCLTGSIGRLRTAYDHRSPNIAERKVNSSGILKNKDASPADEVSVKLEITDDGHDYIIYRAQKKDELYVSDKDVTLQVNYNKHCKGDWLDRHIDQNFYHHHFCDIQKSLNIQNEKREDLAEWFSEFMTDYSREENVAYNLESFSRDAGLRCDEIKGKKSEIERQIEEKEKELENLQNAPTYQAYPSEKIYDGEVTEISGWDEDFLKKQQMTLYACGFSYAADRMKEVVISQNNEELLCNIGRFENLLQEKKTEISEAVRYHLDQNDDCISKISAKVRDHKSLRLHRDNILRYGQQLADFKSEAFTEAFFTDRKKKIENCEINIRNLEEEIQNLTKGNEVVQALMKLLESRKEMITLRNLSMENNGQARCPVCGSLSFGNMEEHQILAQARIFVDNNSEMVSQKNQQLTAAKNLLESQYDEIVSAGKTVLEQQIGKETELSQRLSRLKAETREFFILRENLYKELKEYNLAERVSDLAEPIFMASIKSEISSGIFSEQELDSRRSQSREITDLLNFKIEMKDSDQALLSKLERKCQNAPKISSAFSRQLLADKLSALTSLLQNKEIEKCCQELNAKKEEMDQLEENRKHYVHMQELADCKRDEIKDLIAYLTRQEYEKLGPNLFRFYKKLARINTIGDIRIQADKSGKHILMTDESDNLIVNILSNGQISVFILAYFFAGIVSRSEGEKIKIYFIDDLTAFMDDVNMLAFLDLLKYMLKEENGPMDQLFFATCDDRIYKLLDYKMRGCGILPDSITEERFSS